MNDLASRVASLSPRQRALLESKLRDAAGNGGGAPPIARQSRETNVFPLSSVQERMWFDHQWNPQSPVYNDAICLRIDGPLRVDLLERSQNEIERRHWIWRTTFKTVNGKLSQCIQPPESRPFPVIDLRGLPAEQQEAELSRHSEVEARRPFALDVGPLFRMLLIRLSDTRHVLILVVHHIIFDGWSGGLHFREMFTLYESFAREVASPLAELPLQYADYAVWQRGRQASHSMEKQLAYWKRQLAGCPVALNLPTKGPRPAVRSGNGGCEHLRFEEELTVSLRDLARRHNVTLYMTLLAAFAVVLCRSTGQEELAIGTPVNGRDRKELEGLLGVFLNTLVLRIDLGGSPTFAEFLDRVRGCVGDAFSNREAPFERLVEELHPERDLSCTPLFQAIFDLQKAPKLSLDGLGLSTEANRIHTGTAKFDVSMALVEKDDCLQVEMEYNSDLFDGPAIARMGCHFRNVLEAAVGDPLCRIHQLHMLTPVELARPELVLDRYSEPAPTGVIGLTHDGKQARYRENGSLDFLVSNDRQATVRGFAFELRDIENVLLGHPAVQEAVVVKLPELIAYVGSDARLGGRTGDTEHVARWQSLFDSTYTAAQQVEQHVEPELNTLGWVDSYTGAPIPPEAMREWVDATVERILALRPNDVLEIGCGTGMLLFRIAPLCRSYRATDISRAAIDYVRELARDLPQVALSVGAADDFTGVEPDSLDLVILNSVVQYFPDIGYLEMVMERAKRALRPGGCLFLGDIRNFELLEALHASINLFRAPDSLSGQELRQRVRADITNESELAISPEYFLGSGFSEVHVTVKRGRSANEITQFRYDVVLRMREPECETIEPVMRDWETEGLSLTGIRRILENERPEILPLTNVPNARVARQVRLATLLKDARDAGDLRRSLAQTDVGGGVEPEDLWGLASGLPYQVEVGPKGTDRSDVLICGNAETRRVKRFPFASAAAGKYSNEPLQEQWGRRLVPQLQRLLKETLPGYMMPAVFVVLGKLPETDLPAPERLDHAPASEYQAPRDETEQTLTAIWEEVLRLDRVSVHANFFELGGHSLLAAQVNSRIADKLALELPVRAIFEHPTVADLAEHIEAVKWALAYSGPTPDGAAEDSEWGEL